MALIARDLMVGNPKLAEMGLGEQALGHNAIASGFQGQRQWTDHFPNGDFLEAILNPSFDWNGKRAPYIVATENDALNAAGMLFGWLLTNSAQIFADLRTYWSCDAIKEASGKTLNHPLGEEHRHLAILGEGNTSAKLDKATFLVKASGSSLGSLGADDLVECRFEPLLEMLDRDDLTDQQIEDSLFACRVNPEAKKPSVEALFHAYLLSLPGVGFVGHTHSVAVNSILCSPRAREFADNRLFPDEVVCCGGSSVFVPYTDPGLRLSQIIREGCTDFMGKHGLPPKVILLENQGLITLGATTAAVKAAMFMADKSARIFAAAAVLGGPQFMNAEQVVRISNRIDEHYRQRALNI